LNRIEAKLDAILEHLGIDPASLEDPRIREIREIARGGEKIEAIKRCRDHFGSGLAEAKAAVEELMD
jgi:ribosomal protein L7/L12